MARLVERIRDDLISLLPSGWALGLRGGYIDALLEAIAGLIQIAEVDADRLSVEMDPRTADWLLDSFERVLGPDYCGRDIAGLTKAERRRLAHQRWTSTGGSSAAYFIGIAEKLGVSITIEEFWPSRARVLRAGQRLRPEGCQFVWRVNIPGLVMVQNFRAGGSQAGQKLGTFELSMIECELRRLKPAHTIVVFKYGEV